MIPATCNTTSCRQILFSVESFRGQVETKCSRCRQIHVYTYGGGLAATAEIRCPNSFKGRDMGGWCGQLIARISPDATGSLSYRCPRCKQVKTVRVTSPVLVST